MRAANPTPSPDLKKTKAQLIEELELWRRGERTPGNGHSAYAPEFSSAQLAGILQAADDAIISMDGKSRIRMFNEGAVQIFGFTPAEVMGQSIDMLLPKQVRKIHRRHVENFTQGADISRRMAQRSEVFGVRKNGEKFPAEASISKVEIDGVKSVTVILRDISERKRAEEALQASRRMLEQVFESMAEGISMVDANLNIVAYNRKHLELLDLPDELFAGKPRFEDIIRFNAERGEYGPGDIEEQVRTRVEQAKRFEPHQFERTRPDGTVVEIRGVPLPEGGFVTTYADITERKRSEEALRESEQRMRSVIDHSPSSIFLKDLEGRFTLVNRVLAGRHNRSQEEIIGKTSHDVFPADFADKVIIQDREVLKTGEVAQWEHEVPLPDGTYRTTLNTKFPVLDHEGRTIGVGTISTDITERVWAEEETRKSRALLQTVFDTIPHGVFVKDRNRRYILVNHALAGMMGRKPEDVVGHLNEEVSSSPPEDLQFSYDTDVQVLEQGIAVDVPRFRATLADGRRRIHRLIKLPIRDDGGNVTGLVGLSEDITERVHAEEETLKSQALLKTVFDTIPHWLFVVDRENRFVMVNHAMIESYGLDPDIVEGSNYRDFGSFVTEEDVQRIIETDRIVLETGERHEFPEYVVALPNNEFNIRRSIKLPLRDQYGEITGLVGISEDITEHKQAEKTLLMAQTTIDSSADSIFWTNADAEIEYANDSACRRLGYSREELLGMKVHNIDPGLPRERWEEHWNAVNQAGSKSLESVHRTKDGRLIPVEISITQLQFGDRTYHCAIVHDITERKRAEEALRESEERFRSVIDHSPSAIFLKDLEGRYTLVNRVLAELSGHSEAEMIGRTVNEVFPGEFAKRVTDQEAEVLKTGDVISLERNLPTGDGTERVILSTKFPVMDRDRRIIAVGTITTDITERRQTERELHENQRLLTTVINTIPHWVYAKDVESRYLLVNNAMAADFSVAPADMIGLETKAFREKNDARIGSDQELNALVEMDRQVIATGESRYEPEFILTSPQGRQRVHQISKIPLTDDTGAAVGVVGLSEDVTERKGMEQQLREAQKMEAVGQLAGGIAHEFNNMLQVIINSAQFLKQSIKESAREQDLVDIILRSSARSAELTRQLLAFSRKSVIQPVFLNLDVLISNELQMLGRVIGDYIELEYQTIEDLWPVQVDPGMMEQVILNLCINARDAMPSGGKLIIETENLYADEEFRTAHGLEKVGDYIMVSVNDNGDGMPQDVCDRIFEPFFTTKEVGQGTGLGLAMVQGAVQQHHGIIEVSSILGRGTTFTIYLPRAKSRLATKSQPATDEAAGGHETILVAEDEEDVLGILARSLESRGYRVLSADNGEKALAVFEANAEQVKLVILDMVMPVMNGREVYAKLRERGSKVPVLFSSGYGPNEDDFSFLNDHEIPLIQKPYALNDLFYAVREALDTA